jgi:prepilin-type N-terminal cleavage/methylation domain-containing protein
VRKEKVMKLRKKAERGFTLIELTAAIVVIAVVSLLPAVQSIF